MAESLAELPLNILSEILSRLPIKSLLACRSVCKTFLDLTSSNPHFEFLHSSNAAQDLMLQFGNAYDPTLYVHLVDSELVTGLVIGEKVNLYPVIQIPNYPGRYSERYDMFVGNENNFALVNSCNGLLYFAEQTLCESSFICNPITNEYVTLQFGGEKSQQWSTVGLWFGFSPGENQYKILRILLTFTVRRPWEIVFEYWAQILVVGSCSWRDIKDKPLSEYLSWNTCSALLNGSVYWLCRFPEMSKFIVFFNFQKENFGEILPPLEFGSDWQTNIDSMSIGVLQGCLCVSVNTQILDIWVMDKYGIQGSWTKELAIDTTVCIGSPITGPFRPQQILSNGKILVMLVNLVLVTYDPKKKEFRYFEFDGVESISNYFLFSPSFVPLKDALRLDNVTAG